MLELGAIAFVTPWMLSALLLVPLIYWLLRVTPPAPKQIRFPAIRLLLGLDTEQQTPASAPWWLILLRLLAVTLLILALSHPLIHPGAQLPGSGPVVLVVDNGWVSAQNWPARQASMRDAITRAERNGRPLIILPTARDAAGKPPQPTGLLDPADARAVAESLAPMPWPVDRADAIAALDALRVQGGASALWLSNGAGDSRTTEFAAELQRFGSLTVIAPDAASLPALLRPADTTSESLTVTLLHDPLSIPRRYSARAVAEDGRTLGSATVTLAAGVAEAPVVFDLPVELRNTAVWVELMEERTAGAVALLDERWRRRPVGVASPAGMDEGPALLSEQYYVERALEPFSAIRPGTVQQLMDSRQAVIVVPDSTALSPDDQERLSGWIERGGLLLRFAGPRFARGEGDTMTPVRLRRGGRTLAGAMRWTKPATLHPFESGPFVGLDVPEDVSVSRQVLAEPSLDLTEKTWARLSDGTPLVTAERRGEGWLVLFHTTANTSWTTLPLSGLFVQMLRRVVDQSQGVLQTGSEDRPLAPIEVLDGFGRLTAPTGGAISIAAKEFEETSPGPLAPPGFYGTGDARRALNLGPRVAPPEPLANLPEGVLRAGYDRSEEADLMPYLLLAALLLFMLDMLVSLGMRGVMPRLRRPGATAAAVLALAGAAFTVPAFVAPVQVQAQENLSPEEFALAATRQTTLAYVRTGDPEIDEISRSGLAGLGQVLQNRTAIEVGPPMAVDIERDELTFFALLYWPVSEGQNPPDPDVATRLNRYMDTGGTILFDTRDQNMGQGGRGPNELALRRITAPLDVPPLTTVPPDHVLTKTFYLMQNFPGRWSGGRVWLEESENIRNDGVSRVVIGAHDWAAAWAMDELGRPLYPVVPGGEAQRERAYRFGVNLVMYTLTGSYKSDQVHVPAILERLGQ